MDIYKETPEKNIDLDEISIKTQAFKNNKKPSKLEKSKKISEPQEKSSFNKYFNKIVNNKYFIYSIIFLFGFFYNLYYSRIGYFDIDQSIIFDGGYKILTGQIPFIDFYTPNGFIPIYIQSFFFSILGINWFSYCVHSSTFNGLFGIIIYLIMIKLKSDKKLAFLTAILSCICFYPPIGTPYMETHAFFFISTALLFSLKFFDNTTKRNYLYLFFISLSLIFSYFSKQIPGVFGILLIFILFIFKKKFKEIFIISFFSILILLPFMIFFINRYGLIKFYFFDLPLSIGKDRIDILFFLKRLALFIINYKLIILNQILIFYVIFKYFKKENFKILLSQSLIFVMLLFLLLTANERENAMAFYFLISGIVLLILKNKEFKYSKIIKILFFLFLIIDLLSIFNVNETRTTNNVYVNANEDLQNLGFLKWKTNDNVSRDDFDELINFLIIQNKSYFMMSSYNIIYGLTDLPSTSLSLWFHEGLTFPRSDTAEFETYIDELLSNIEKRNVNFIIFLTDKYFMGESINNSSKFQDYLNQNYCTTFYINKFEILEKC
jgi:hypothetical protein